MQKSTKELISSAFIKLVEEKPFDKITIKDIVTECNINRNTFYYYYSDVYDLLEEIFKKEMYFIVESHEKTGTWMEGFLRVANVARDHKKFIHNVCNSRSYDYFENYMFRACHHIIVEVVTASAEDRDVPKEDIEFIATFYEHGLVGTISEWFKSGMKTDPIELVGQLWLVLDNIKYSLRRSEKRKRELDE